MSSLLIVEDNEMVRHEMEAILSFEGHRVVAVENGREALEVLAIERPEAILCDMMMPELDGLQTLERIRADPDLDTIPFVFVTAVAERADLRRAMARGADDYITKPFTAVELIESVQAVLVKRTRTDREADRKVDGLRRRIHHALPHEFRTPLNGILGFGQLLQDLSGEMWSEELNEYSEHIVSSAHRLNHLVENFLLFADLELGGESSNVSTHDLDVRELIEACIHDVGDRCRIEAVPAAGTVSTQLPASRFAKILKELLDNAVKFSDPDTPIRVTARADRWMFIVDVEDEGRGMGEDEQRLIGAYAQFGREQFEQQGMGLGLAIVSKLVSVHGGSMEITSALDVGTRVTVAFRLEASATAEASPTAARPTDWD